MRMIIIVYTFLLILMPIVSSASELQELSVSIGPERNLPYSGENNIDVAIVAKDIKNISNIQLSLKYNPEVLVVNNVTKGYIDAQFLSNIDLENPGNIVIEIGKDTGFSLEEGSIANIKFIVKGRKGTSSNLNLTIIKVLDTSSGYVSVPTVTNAKYVVGRERIISPLPGRETTIPTIQETTSQETTKEASGFGFGILMSAFILVLIVLFRKR